MTINDFSDTFAYTAERSAPSGPILQWATGLPTTDRRIVAGWITEAGRDEGLDRAALGAGFDRVTIKHGSGKVVTHWHLEAADLLLIARAVPTINELRRSPLRSGIAFSWAEGERSKLRAQVYVKALVAVGYEEPLTITAKSTQTGDVIAALQRLYDLIDASGRLAFPLYAFWLPTGPGADVERGAGDNTRTFAPLVALVPETITREWLRGQYAGKDKDLIGRVEAAMESVVAWSSQGEPTETAGAAEAVGEDAAAIRARIKAITGAASWTALLTWLGDSSYPQPKTIEAWQKLAGWVGTIAQERAKATNGVASPPR
jgi:hypothetical protein